MWTITEGKEMRETFNFPSLSQFFPPKSSLFTLYTLSPTIHQSTINQHPINNNQSSAPRQSRQYLLSLCPFSASTGLVSYEAVSSQNNLPKIQSLAPPLTTRLHHIHSARHVPSNSLTSLLSLFSLLDCLHDQIPRRSITIKSSLSSTLGTLAVTKDTIRRHSFSNC